MLPESKIPDYIDSNPQLYCRLRMDLNQNTYENIDEEFPYQQLTLREIGIPYFDILQITTESGYFYVELTKDESKYPFK
jgi:adenylyltransferase/sulfurtransferase